jgi:molecular chaperone HscB
MEFNAERFLADHFSLFDMPPAFRLDAALLDRRYLELQSRIHPDRFANSSEAERRHSLQWATRVNEGYQTLRKPLARAKYLLQLAGQEIGSESSVLIPVDFLVEQMEWREAVAESRAAGDHHELERLHHRLKRDMLERYEEVAVLLDDQSDLAQAADRVRRLMFLEKLLVEIDEAMTACDG